MEKKQFEISENSEIEFVRQTEELLVNYDNEFDHNNYFTEA